MLLRPHDRGTVEEACRKHCEHRGWHLFAVSARRNHVHVVVAADSSPQKVRDQLKANCTGALRRQQLPLRVDRTWTKGGDCEILDRDDDIEAAVIYTTEAQDRKDREINEPTALAAGLEDVRVATEGPAASAVGSQKQGPRPAPSVHRNRARG